MLLHYSLWSTIGRGWQWIWPQPPATRDSVLQRQMQLSVECHILVMAQKRPERDCWCVCVCAHTRAHVSCCAVVLMLDWFSLSKWEGKAVKRKKEKRNITVSRLHHLAVVWLETKRAISLPRKITFLWLSFHFFSCSCSVDSQLCSLPCILLSLTHLPSFPWQTVPWARAEGRQQSGDVQKEASPRSVH